MVLCLRRICLDLPIYILGFYHIGISSKKWRSHSASYLHLFSAINSYSIVHLAITICFEDFHETAAPPNVNT